MRLYEYEAKFLLRRYRIPTAEGFVYTSASDLSKISYPCVVKAQTFVGGRGKSGGIKFAKNETEVLSHIELMKDLIIAGYPVTKILIERQVEIRKEYYVSLSIDRIRHQPLLICSTEGGMDIEEVAKEKPSKIQKLHLEPQEKVEPYFGRKIASLLGMTGEQANAAGPIIFNLAKIFFEYDCKVVEINPLVLTTDSRILAVDAKVDLDDDAVFRHPELREWGIELRHEIGEFTEREKKARAVGISYVDLDGYVGSFPGGAGFGIAAIDLIEHYGGKAANFMDSGGAPTQERLKLMLGLLMDNPRVTAIFGARFGGISRCDDWAKAVVQYVLENKPAKPMIMRMAGNMEEEGRKILEEAIRNHSDLFRNIKIYRYDTPIEDVIKEAVRVAKERKGK